jgi:hypothetical protein
MTALPSGLNLRARDACLPVLGFGVDDDLDIAGFAFCGDFVERGEHLLGGKGTPGEGRDYSRAAACCSRGL